MVCQPCAAGSHLHRDGCMSHYCMRSHDLMSHVQQSNGETSLSSKGEVHRELKGALVKFGPGAEVSGVNFSSDDYYEVRVSCGQQACVAERLQDHLATLEQFIPNSRVTSTQGPEGTRLYIYDRFTDKHHAEALRAKLASDPLRHLFPKFEVDIKDGSLEDWNTSCFSAICFERNSVRCYWPRPSRNALLYFDTIYQAKEAEKILRDPEIRIHGRRIHARYEDPDSGRRIHARYEDPDRHLNKPGIRIRYLDASVMYQTITNKLPANVRPNTVKLGNPSYRTAFPHVERAMMELLSRYGPIVNWQVSEKCNHRDSRAIVRFQNLEDAQAATRELEGYRLPAIAHSRLRMRRNVSLRFRGIPGSVFELLKEEIDTLRKDLHQAGQVRMEITYQTGHCQREFIDVQLSGRHALSVAKAKSAVQNLLAGELAIGGSSKLWDDCFAESNGSIYFGELGTICKGLVRLDVNTEQIFLYGSAQVKTRMLKAILATLAMQKGQGIVLRGPDHLGRPLPGTYRRICEVTGQQRAGLNAGSSTKKIIISASREVSENATNVSHEPKPRVHEDNTNEDNNSEPDCLICLTPASDPFQTTCGHIYCKSCFAHQCSAATTNGMIPIRCLGDDNCSHIFTLEELKTYLPHGSFEQLLETSIAQYVRSNSKSFRHCPTPDCPSIYRLDTKRDKLLCHSCLNIICISCQVQDHSGKSCEAYKAAMKAEETFTKWKQENNVKDCPQCDAPIEKTDGCNHVECTNCANHICWQCMASFPTGPEVYKHMGEEHGTFMVPGEEWQEGDEDEEEEEGEEDDDGDPFDLDLERAMGGFPLDEMVFARPNRHRHMPVDVRDFLLGPPEYQNQPPIQAPRPPLPRQIIPPPWLALFRARMDEDENMIPPAAAPGIPAPPPGNPAPPLQNPPQPPRNPPQPRHRRLRNGVMDFLFGLLRNNIPRAAPHHHHHNPQPIEMPVPPAAFLRNAAQMLGRPEDEDDDDDSEYEYEDENEDGMEIASERSHATEHDLPAPHPNETHADDNNNIYNDESDIPRRVDEDEITEAEEELEIASGTDSDTETDFDTDIGTGTDTDDGPNPYLWRDWRRWIGMRNADVEMEMDEEMDEEIDGDVNMDGDGDGDGRERARARARRDMEALDGLEEME